MSEISKEGGKESQGFFLRQCSFSGVLHPLFAQRSLDLSFAYLLLFIYVLTLVHSLAFGFFEFWNSGQLFHNKSFQDISRGSFPKSFFKGRGVGRTIA